MTHSASDQLESIHAMLDSGHHSVRMDSHSLVIWGLAGGFLCVVGDWLITPANFPERWQQALVLLALVGGVLTGAGFSDYRLTQRMRQARDETLPFVQRQIVKVWWLLMGLGLLVNNGMIFYGGGYMSYGLWMFLVGLALTIHGLFSQQPLKWYGTLLLLLGVGVVLTHIPHEASRWLAAVAFGIGLPILGVMLSKQRATRVWSMAWIALILVIGGSAYWGVYRLNIPRGAVVSLEDFVGGEYIGQGVQILRIPARTEIPLKLVITGDVVDDVSDEIPLTLSKALDIGLRDGRATSWYRIDQGVWRDTHANLRIVGEKLEAIFEPGERPRSDIMLRVHTGR